MSNEAWMWVMADNNSGGPTTSDETFPSLDAAKIDAIAYLDAEDECLQWEERIPGKWYSTDSHDGVRVLVQQIPCTR